MNGLRKAICKECGQPFEQPEDKNYLVCMECEEEIAQAEDEENEQD